MPACSWCDMPEGQHTFDCAELLGVYPTPKGDWGLMLCLGCDEPFEPGSLYAYIDEGDDEGEPGPMLAVCLGCAAHHELVTDAGL